MAWSTTKPTLPSGASWSAYKENTGQVKDSYYIYKIKSRIARGTNSAFFVEVQLIANQYAYGTTPPAATMRARIKYGASGTYANSDPYSINPSFGYDAIIKTLYWTGSREPGDAVYVDGYVNSNANTADVGFTVPAYVTQYTVYYDGNYNTGGYTAPQTFTFGSGVTISENGFTKTGYYFTGWSDGWQPGYWYAQAANITLYAQWAIYTYPITYNGNGATGGSTAGQTKNYGANIAISSNGFTRTNYTFLYWNTKADGTGTTYYPGNSYGTNAALTLYAIWKKNNIPIYVNDNDTIRQVEKAYMKVNGTIKECTVYLNVNGVIKTIV